MFKPDYDQIIKWVEPGSRVLDVGCGEGLLLDRLIKEKNVHGVGVDNDAKSLDLCITKGLSVIQSNVDQGEGLKDFPDQTFDYAILNDTLQALHRPLEVLLSMLRLSKKVIVGFPNFAHLVPRFYLLFQGRMPMSKAMPNMWYDTPNIHFMTVKDFRLLCKDQGITVLKQRYFGEHFETVTPFFANLWASEAVFLIEK